MTPNLQDPYVAALLSRVQDDPQCVGLVLCGSSAEPERRDQWSDHDFLLVTTDGTPEHYRQDLSWLPDHQDIAFSFRETAHGLKALYRTGLIVEFAVFDRREFSECALNHYAVVFDRGGISDVAAQVRDRSMAPRPFDRLASFRLFLSLIYIGTGRARRGERLSAQVMVRCYATEHLLRVLRDTLPDHATGRLDALDAWRRFESADPEAAQLIDDALGQPVDRTAEALLRIADDILPARWPDYPRSDVAVVRALLDW